MVTGPGLLLYEPRTVTAPVCPFNIRIWLPHALLTRTLPSLLTAMLVAAEASGGRVPPYALSAPTPPRGVSQFTWLTRTMSPAGG